MTPSVTLPLHGRFKPPFPKRPLTAASMVRLFCCFHSASLVTNRLAGSTHLFLCSTLWSSPLLYTIGLATATLQGILLLLVWSRAEANMFYEFYAHGLVTVNSTDLYAFNASDLGQAFAQQLKYRFPSRDVWANLGRTGEPGEGIAAAGSAGGASFTPHVDSQAGIERYNVMIQWSTHHKFLPQFATHPDLQVAALSSCIASHRIPPPPLPSSHPSSPRLASPQLTYLQPSLLLSPAVPTASNRAPPPAPAFLHPLRELLILTGGVYAQLDYALLFSLVMLFVWIAKDAIDSLWCIAGGYVVTGSFIGALLQLHHDNTP